MTRGSGSTTSRLVGYLMIMGATILFGFNGHSHGSSSITVFRRLRWLAECS